MKELENKKSLIGYVVKNEELYNISKIVVNKSLKVMECKGNLYASNLYTYKNSYCKDIYEDLIQEVVISILENNYIIQKNNFLVVNNYLYNNITKIKQFEKISIESEDANDVELLNYTSFLAYNNNKIMIENAKKGNEKNIIDALELTEKQREILDIYAKTMNAQRTADLLGLHVNTIKTTIKRIREKTQKLDIKIA